MTLKNAIKKAEKLSGQKIQTNKNMKNLKTVIIENYINGLGSYLDDNNITWSVEPDGKIRIHYSYAEQLFLLAFSFGRCYQNELTKTYLED